MFGSGGIANWMADSPAQGGQTVRHTNQICTRDLCRLWWKSKLNGGWSAPGARTVRRSFQVLYQRGCFSSLCLMVERRTVRPWGADGPPVIFKSVPETFFVSGGVELITADGPPVGRERSARAPTASSDTQSLHSDSLVYKGGQSGF